MFKFLNLQPEIFGMDINDLSLRIVKLKKRRNGFSLVSFNEVNIRPGVVKEGVIQDQEALIKAIKIACSTVKGEKLNTKYVAASLPEEKSFSQIIQTPNMTDEELKSAVPFEAENYIPLPIDKVYLDFQIINPHHFPNLDEYVPQSLSQADLGDKNHLDLLINVIPTSIADSYVYCFKAAGLVPCILEVESQSIARALIKNGEAPSPLLLIDLGVANTSFVIFSGNSIRFTSSILMSSKDITNAIADNLGFSLDKAEELKVEYGLVKEGDKKYNIARTIKPILINLVSQIKKYVSFYHGHASHEYLLSDEGPGKKIEKIILCGGGANLKGISDFLRDELKIPIEIGNPFTNIVGQSKTSCQIIPQQKILSFTTALGLALRGVSENSE